MFHRGHRTCTLIVLTDSARVVDLTYHFRQDLLAVEGVTAFGSHVLGSDGVQIANQGVALTVFVVELSFFKEFDQAGARRVACADGLLSRIQLVHGFLLLICRLLHALP